MIKDYTLSINDPDIVKVVASSQDNKPVRGLTHEHYKYPARFSPRFANSVIRAFTEPGDIVYDPFMGGGTTLVEASALGRNTVGTDINSLAVFISKVKTTVLKENQLKLALDWLENIFINDALNLQNRPRRALYWKQLGYQKNISGLKTWPIRKLIELILYEAENVGDEQINNLIRCALLQTGQWALDLNEVLPRASQFRLQFKRTLLEMVESTREYSNCIKKVSQNTKGIKLGPPKCIHCSVNDIQPDIIFNGTKRPALIITSPPYPGVHALYHRWQVNGRRETPAPFWIANCMDGNGETYYTLGHRRQKNLSNYFENIRNIFKILANISEPHTIIVQLIAFSSPSWQLNEYLSAINDAGFKELLIEGYNNSNDGRVWRTVPHRKFYAGHKGAISASKEVVLFHQLS